MCFAEAKAIGDVLGTLKPAVEWVGKEISTSRDAARQLDAARLERVIAEERAKAEIAAWKVKSDIEWDLKWADGAVTSWKDELLLLIWLFPTIGLFVPGLREGVQEGFEYLKSFNPDAPAMFMAGWAVIFSASFGLKQALQFMLPSRYASLIGALNSATPDIPLDVAQAAQKAVSAAKKS